MLVVSVDAQSTLYNITLKPVQDDSIGGIQSYSFGQSNGKWVIVDEPKT